MNMNISERDKQLLYILLAAAIVFCAWFFGFRTFNEKAQEYKDQTAQLETRYNDLLEKQKNKAQYIADTSYNNEESAKIIAQYTNGHSLENTIKYIYEMEDLTDIFIGEFTISDGQVAYSFADGQKQGIVINMNFTYESTYDEVKELIDYINTYESKCSIDSMSITYDSERDIATGSVTMNTYAIITPESVEPDVDIDMPVGNENIFMATSAFYSENTSDNGASILEDNDMVIELAQPQANMPSISIKLTDSDDDPLTSNSNDEEEIEIVFSGVEGRYTVAYKIGDESYPSKNYEDGVLFEPGDTLDVLVSSMIRANTKDNLSVNAVIVNDTDKMLNIKIIDDDEAQRFNVVGKTGRIKIYD